MRRQRASIHSTLCGAFSARLRGNPFRLSLAGGLGLLGLFQPEQQLVFRQRFGSSAKAGRLLRNRLEMTLQLLDDLAKPFILDELGDQHRLQRTGIVGKRVGDRRHVENQITFAGSARRENRR